MTDSTKTEDELNEVEVLEKPPIKRVKFPKIETQIDRLINNLLVLLVENDNKEWEDNILGAIIDVVETGKENKENVEAYFSYVNSHKKTAKPARLISSRRRFLILKRDNYTCKYCGKKAPETELHVDHILAVANGGSDEDVNLTTACVDCNQGKSDILL